MVSLFSSLSSMDLKKVAFSDHLVSSQRRKVVSPCSFGIVLFFIVLSALLFSFSSRAPFVQELYNFSSRGNTSSSFGSWRYPVSFGSSANSTLDLRVPLNESLDANATVSETGAGSVESGGGEKGIESVPAVNQSVSFEERSFILEGSVGVEVVDSRNGSQPLEDSILVDDSGKSKDSGPPRVGDSIDDSKNGSVSGGGLKNSTANSVESLNGSVSDGDLRHEGKNTPSPATATAPAVSDRSFKKCDIYKGRWVRDDAEPYYPPGSCPFIDKDFDCHLNGRPDSEYVKWRWQPYDCDIPRLNVTDFLERLRGKKLVFVGDSLNRNMWESLVCVLRHGVANKSRVYEISGKHEFKKKGFYAFLFEDYNCTVDFVSSPFLVKESSFSGKNGSFETLRLDLMDSTTSMYHDADVLIFNTGHWWTHEKTSRGEDYYQEGNVVHSRLKVLEAFKRALITWAKWVDKNIDHTKTEVIFRGYSETHFRGGPWNAGGQCNNETEPIMNDAYLAKYPSKMKILEYVLKDAKTPISYLNITHLTDYRKDGHPSVYRPDYVQAQKEVHAQDCSHWCLPGVPDIWNQLLYVSLLQGGRGSWGA